MGSLRALNRLALSALIHFAGRECCLMLAVRITPARGVGRRGKSFQTAKSGQGVRAFFDLERFPEIWT